MVASDTSYLTIDTFLNVVVIKKFPLLHLRRYLFNEVNDNIDIFPEVVIEMQFVLLPLVMYFGILS